MRARPGSVKQFGEKGDTGLDAPLTPEAGKQVPRGPVAYVMSRFPHLPETFILREMEQLQRRGWDIQLCPLIFQRQPVVHDEARQWIETLHSPPPFAFRPLFAHPRGAPASLALLGRCVRENWRDAKLLSRAIYLFPIAVSMAKHMQLRGVRHIHAHYATHPALVAWIIHRITGISYSITAHAHDIFVHTAMLDTKLRDASFVIAISNFNREHLARLAGPWVREKTHVIHCGIEPARYKPCLAAAPGKRFEFLSVGSLQPYKGFPRLLEACAMLRDRGLSFRCRIIGGGTDLDKLIKSIRRLHIEEQVELMGPRSQAEVAGLLPGAHCYVQPSIITSSGKMEGIPVAIMEAMACGLPVVATAISGIPELVADGVTGHLVPSGDACALAGAMEAVLKDPASAARCGAAGREKVQREFSLEANVDRLAALFSGVIQKPA